MIIYGNVMKISILYRFKKKSFFSIIMEIKDFGPPKSLGNSPGWRGVVAHPSPVLSNEHSLYSPDGSDPN